MSEKLNEKKWLIIFSIFLILITSLPYFIGFELAKTNDSQFSGFIFGVEDGNSYIAKMLLGQKGDWLFRTPFTAYEQKGFLAFFPYIILGKLASSPDNHVQLIILFHMFRCLGIFFLVFEINSFMKLFLSSLPLQRTAVLISCIGGGLGWISIIALKNIPLEFYSPESFGFLSLFGLPHLCFSRGLMLRSFRMIISPGKDIFNFDRKITSGIYLFLSGLFQPLNIPLGWILIGTWKLYNLVSNKEYKLKDIFMDLFFYLLIPLPFFLYNAFMFLFDPFLSSWESQNIIKSPQPLEYFFAYGFGYFCLIYSTFILKNKPKSKTFLIIWSVLLPVLVYLPINLQRRLADGFWIVLSIFITLFIYSINKPFWRWVLIGFSCLSTIFLFIGSITAVQNHEAPIFQSNDLIKIFNRINEEGKINDVVLAPYSISNILPGYIPMRVVTGHGPESKNLKEIDLFIDRFSQGSVSDEQMQLFFQQFDIRFVIFDASSPGIHNFEDYFLEEKLFENSHFSLFQLNIDEDL